MLANARFVILSNGNIHYLGPWGRAIRRSSLPFQALMRLRTTTLSSRMLSASLPKRLSVTLSFSPRCLVKADRYVAAFRFHKTRIAQILLALSKGPC
jgi:hypothetical protein